MGPHEESLRGLGPCSQHSLGLLAALCRDGVLIVDPVVLLIEQQHHEMQRRCGRTFGRHFLPEASSDIVDRCARHVERTWVVYLPVTVDRMLACVFEGQITLCRLFLHHSDSPGPFGNDHCFNIACSSGLVEVSLNDLAGLLVSVTYSTVVFSGHGAQDPIAAHFLTCPVGTETSFLWPTGSSIQDLLSQEVGLFPPR